MATPDGWEWGVGEGGAFVLRDGADGVVFRGDLERLRRRFAELAAENARLRRRTADMAIERGKADHAAAKAAG